MITLLLVPLALAVGVATLIAARARALARPLPAGLDAETPLTDPERARLRLWERRLRRAVLLAGAAYLAVFASWWIGGGDGAGRPSAALALFGVTCLLATAVQFSGRCPRCGYNLGFQARLLLPERCERCHSPCR